jgi:hypothetical protein
MQKVNTQQFSDMNEKMMTTMESNHTMSTTMLDMRKQFEQMSKFMNEMADTLEKALQRPAASTSVEMTLSQHRAKRTQQRTSSNSTSSQSKMSQDSSQDSSIYKSPEKKKQRPREKARQDKTMEADKPQIAAAYSEEWDLNLDIQKEVHNFDGNVDRAECEHDSTTVDTTEVCLNLEDIFNYSQMQDTQSPRPTAKLLMSKDNEDNAPNHQLRTIAAPLDPQYTINMDSFGATGL